MAAPKSFGIGFLGTNRLTIAKLYNDDLIAFSDNPGPSINDVIIHLDVADVSIWSYWFEAHNHCVHDFSKQLCSVHFTFEYSIQFKTQMGQPQI